MKTGQDAVPLCSWPDTEMAATDLGVRGMVPVPVLARVSLLCVHCGHSADGQVSQTESKTLP